jgi:hypothetical protein
MRRFRLRIPPWRRPILCGKQAIDDDAGAVGPALAQLLGIPHLTSIVELEIFADKREARAAREIEGGREIVACPLPALFSAQKGLNEPRIPQVAGVMKAMRAKFEKIDLKALGLSPEDAKPKTKILKFYPPQKRPPVKMIEDDRGGVSEECRGLGEGTEGTGEGDIGISENEGKGALSTKSCGVAVLQSEGGKRLEVGGGRRNVK